MSDTIIAVIISGIFTILTTVITVVATAQKTAENMRTAQAVTETKLGQLKTDVEELKTDVRAHNEFGRRIPVLEERTNNLAHRIDEIEQKVS